MPPSWFLLIYIFQRTEELTAKTKCPEFSWTVAFHYWHQSESKCHVKHPFLDAKASLEPDRSANTGLQLVRAPSQGRAAANHVKCQVRPHPTCPPGVPRWVSRAGATLSQSQNLGQAVLGGTGRIRSLRNKGEAGAAGRWARRPGTPQCPLPTAAGDLTKGLWDCTKGQQQVVTSSRNRANQPQQRASHRHS